MEWQDHLRTTGGALKNWFIAQTYDALAVAALWLVGLLLLRVPWAPFWALLAFAFQYIPNVGTMFALIGPAIAAAFAGGFEEWDRFIGVLILYAVIVVLDGLVLQPYFMRRMVKVPIWASIFVPIIFAIVLPFWGVLLAAPTLSIYYAYRGKRGLRPPPAPPPPPAVSS